MNISQKSLRQKIDFAFSAHIPPEFHRITIGNPLNPEDAEVERFFLNRRWEEISEEDVQNVAHALSYFTPQAQAYFLPVFLKASLQENPDSNLLGYVSHLLSPNPGQRNALPLEMTQFSIAELTVIIEFIEHLRGQSPDDWAFAKETIRLIKRHLAQRGKL